MKPIMMSSKILCFLVILAYIADATTTATSFRRDFQHPPERENSSSLETLEGTEAFDESDDFINVIPTMTVDNVREILENEVGPIGDAEVEHVHRMLLLSKGAHSQRALISEYLMSRNPDGGTQVRRANTKTLLQNIQLFQGRQVGHEENRE